MTIIKLNVNQKIGLQIGLILICMFLLIPTTNNETILNLILPTILKIYSENGSRVFFINFNLVLILVAVVSFFKLRNNLKQLNSKWIYLMYFVILVWVSSSIKTSIGEKVMSFRKGLQVVEFQFDKSEIRYSKDSLGIIHAEGNLTFRNYGTDTVNFKGILLSKDFQLMNGDTIADIIFTYETSSDTGNYIKISPESTYSYPVKFDSKLKVCTSTHSTYNGTINIITKFTIYSDNESKIFEY